MKKAEPAKEHPKPKEAQVEKTSQHPAGTTLDWRPLINSAIKI
jgi:hypothetical protein